MAKKVCGNCGEKKSEKEFPWRNKAAGKRGSMCKECHRTYTKEDYLRNPDYYKDKARRKKEALRLWLQNLKTNTPCADCGQKFHYCVMDFDHVDTDKLTCVARLVWSGSKRQLEKEITKCEIVCANCHRLRTFQRNASQGSVREVDKASGL